MEARMKCPQLEGRLMSAQQAAQLITDGMVVATSGFALSGYPKAVPHALAERVTLGEDIGITLIAGASVGDELDGELARAGAVRRRYPFQSNPDMRRRINRNEIAYTDLHLSQLTEQLRKGIFGPIDIGILEVNEIGPNGELYLTTSVGISQTIVGQAKALILEINTAQPVLLTGMHDLYETAPPPCTQPIPITAPGQRIGSSFLCCDLDKIAAIVYSSIPDPGSSAMDTGEEHRQMAEHLLSFLKQEIARDRLSLPLPPFQSGVGGVANAVLKGLVDSDLTKLTFYSEVLQDAVLDLIDSGKLLVASACGLSFTKAGVERFQAAAERYVPHMILRPLEISNSGEVIHRLGVIAMNTAVDCDIYGNVDSTHIEGTQVINGIGGSGDFARHAGLSVFFTASTAKNGTLSCIVPFCSHIDHTEHDVHLIITEQGAADLRGLSPRERARSIIDHCAHPKFRPALRQYLKKAEPGHIPHDLGAAFLPLQPADAGTYP